MEENNTTMTPDTMDIEMNSAWDNDDDSWESAEEPADQPEQQQEVTTAPKNNEGQPAADQPQEGDADQQTPVLYTLKNREETRQVTLEEMRTMAQKGWDYDKVKTENDQLRQYREQNAAAVEFLNRHAQSQGLSVQQYLQQMQKQELLRTGMSDAQAEREIQFQREKAQVEAQKRAIDAFQQTRNSAQMEQQKKQEAFKQSVADFKKAYPDKKPEEIPKEVWAKVGQGVPLLSAYTMHENAQLKAQLAAEQQNKANQKRSPGGLGGNLGAELDEMDRIWDEDD